MSPTDEKKLGRFIKECARSWSTQYSKKSKFSIDFNHFRVVLEYILTKHVFFLGVVIFGDSKISGSYLEPEELLTLIRKHSQEKEKVEKMITSIIRKSYDEAVLNFTNGRDEE